MLFDWETAKRLRLGPPRKQSDAPGSTVAAFVWTVLADIPSPPVGSHRNGNASSPEQETSAQEEDAR